MKISGKLTGCFFLIIFVSMFVTACQKSDLSKDFEQKLLDMTYPFNENTIYWPNANPFKLQKGDWGITEEGYWYASNEYCAAEHGGTHADAPIHFAKNGRTIDQIPLREWIGPAVKIDVTEQSSQDRDYLLTVEDVKNWEKKHGTIPEHAWVIMYTGIDTKYYPDKEKVLGTEKTGEKAIPELHFPGFSPESVQFLTNEREITGIAIDTPSIDYGQSKEFKVHQILFAADKIALENIAKLDQLPEAGAILYVMPMMIENGTGSPARVFAVLP